MICTLLQLCMRLCLHQGLSEEDKHARGHSSRIEQDLSDERQARRDTNEVTILLLGECWWSTSRCGGPPVAVVVHQSLWWSTSRCGGLDSKGLSEEDKHARGHSSRIEQDLSDERQARRDTNEVTILLLGAAESGKSTLVKQMKLIHSHGFTKQELISFKPAVLDNLLTSMKFVLQGMGMLRINLCNKSNKAHARALLSCPQCVGDDQELVPFAAHAFLALWADPGVRSAAARGQEFDLNDSALYFFEDVIRITAPNYVPTEMDVLRVRVRTCGIIETQFEVNNVVFR
ncbi:hypothetical protein CRUP_008264 [Coryphaenoides rupestris]|nr:hypothetical protein CRUP_008264 [Coryphaenoides rupestris]